MAIVGYSSSTRRALDTFVRGTVTDRFDRNRRVLRLNIDVTAARMNDLDAAFRSPGNYRSVTSSAGPAPRRVPGPTS